MDCKKCEANNEKTPVTVPLFAVEGQSYRSNKTMRYMVTIFCVALLIIAIVIGLCGIVVYRTNRDCLDKVEAINAYWLDFISQYDFDCDTYTQDGRGINIIGDGNGVTDYGTTDDYSANDEEGR